MPTFFTFDGIRICLFFNDHLPPHFHAYYAEYELVIDIRAIKVLQGSFPRKQRKKVLEFARNNRSDLMEIWESLQS